MFGVIKDHISNELDEIRQSGLYKAERIITSPQKMHITIEWSAQEQLTTE
jgi:glycine C-acetyltransferase